MPATIPHTSEVTTSQHLGQAHTHRNGDDHSNDPPHCRGLSCVVTETISTLNKDAHESGNKEHVQTRLTCARIGDASEA